MTEEIFVSSKAAAKVQKPSMAEEIGPIELELELPPPIVGDTLAGDVFVTTHTCPKCQSMMETIGAGHPKFVCSRCNLAMKAESERVVFEDDR